MLRKMLGILLCAAMVIGLLPGMLPAAKAELGIGKLFVGGVDIVADADHVIEGGNGTATLTYDTDGNPILTLNNYTYSGEGYCHYVPGPTNAALIYLSGTALIIELEGESSLTCTAGNSYSMGLCSDNGDVTIRGKGKLTVKGIGGQYAAGVLTHKNLKISSGAINAEGSGSVIQNAGIVCSGSVEVSGGKVTATGRDIQGNDSDSIGILLYNQGLAINGGTVKASGGVAHGNSYGIDAAQNSGKQVTIGPSVELVELEGYVKATTCAVTYQIEGTGGYGTFTKYALEPPSGTAQARRPWPAR